MPIIACPHCGTKLNGPDSVLGKEVICGQCRQRFIAAAEAPFGSQYARPAPPRASRETGFESMESLTPGPAQEPGPAPQPPGEPLRQEPQPAQWQAPRQQEPPAPQPPRPAGPTWAPLPFSGGPPQPSGSPQAPPPVPPPAGQYDLGLMPGQPYGPCAPGGMLPRASGATAALALGIVAIIGGVFSCCCLWPVGIICGILAIIFGSNATRAIDAGRADRIDRGKAVAGRVCGIIGMILGILGAIWFLVSIASGGFKYNFNQGF